MMTFSLFAFSFSILALIVALAALAMVIGMKLSTHRIEWKPLELGDTEDEVIAEEEAVEEEDLEILDKAVKLSKEAKSKKKPKDHDPLDDILETNNF